MVKIKFSVVKNLQFVSHFSPFFPTFSNDFVHPSKSISFSEMIITQHMDLMYISDSTTGNLYSMSLTPVRFLNLSNFNGDMRKLSIRSPLTFIGSLLGPAKALTMSPKGEILYIVDRFSGEKFFKLQKK